MFDTPHVPRPPVVLSDSTSAADIMRLGKETLQDLVLDCAAQGVTAEATLQLVAAARRTADAMESVLKARSTPGESRNVLASALVKNLASKEVTKAVVDLRTMANEIESRAATGVLMSGLSDAEKQRALLFGKHLNKAAGLRPADYSAVAAALEAHLKSYCGPESGSEGAIRHPEDLALVDSIHLFSQREALEDAAGVLPELLACGDTAELLSVLPLIGRAVQVKTRRRSTFKTRCRSTFAQLERRRENWYTFFDLTF